MLRRVIVENLFGYLSYKIDFSSKNSQIVLLHGPNGSGKTTIFEMIKGINDLNFKVFHDTPFTKFIVETYNSSFYIHKTEDNILNINGELELPDEAIPYMPSHREGRSILENYGAKQVGAMVYEYEGKLYQYRRLLQKLLKDEPFRQLNVSDIPESIKSFRDELNILYIGAERLSTNQSRKVVTHTEKLKKIIIDHENKYAILSKDLDAKFPKKIITKSRRVENNIDSVDIANRLQELSVKRNQLSMKGILSENDTDGLIPPDEIKSDDIFDNPYLKQFLYYYILDNEKKLDVFNDLLTKIDLFEKIINSYFVNKDIQINKKDGYFLRLTKGLLKGETIPLKSLSSGEQHFLVLFFELIFNTEKNRIILIDEPELSLHVSWQINLVDILIDIINFSGDFFVLATHSPSILRNHRDKVIPVGYEDENV